ncbi:MAG: tRNA (adenosine(37)-N6)-threonylcarbamoyltransferase complex dimerization subunit type 1 TsaB [Patescibacteria group bacterium]
MILAINTASSQTAIALLDSVPGNVNLIAEQTWPSQNREAETLMPNINELLQKNNKTFADIKEVYVVKGPGSFTGLRVGITVANTIAFLNKCDLFGISTFEYWHVSNGLPLLVFAGSGAVYLNLDSGAEPKIINCSDLYEELKKLNIKEVFGDITSAQKEFLKDIRFIETKESFGEIMAKAISKNSAKSVKIIEPVYIKEPSITQIKKP